MNDNKFPINRQTWQRFVDVIKAFATSEVGGKAIVWTTVLVSLLLGFNGLNVLNSYVGRDFMTAIAERNQSEFVWKAVLFLLVFAITTVVAVLLRYCEESLGILFREWMAKRYVNSYLANRAYYHLKAGGKIINPDERISDDVRTFTVTTLSFLIMFLNASITVIAFSGVMWSISPKLFLIAIAYAALGSYLAIKLGRPLVGLNFHQLDKEADFRAALIHIRENAESIALSRREGRLSTRLMLRVDAFAANFRQIIDVNRKLGFFTTGYNYLIQLIPLVVAAPMFIRGDVEFGVITQSAMVFAMLVGAFSLIVNLFQPISSYTAVLSRLNQLWDAMEAGGEPAEKEGSPKIDTAEEEGQIKYEHLTLYSSEDNRILLKDLTVTIPHGKRLLISGPNEAAKLALFRATADMSVPGVGKISRPSLDRIRFLPQRAYLYPGTLRELLLRSGEEFEISDERLLAALEELGLGGVLVRAHGLDVEQDWPSFLSLGEEQLLAFTRLLLAAPQFAFLDRVYSALNPEQAWQILLKLSMESITYIVLDDAKNLPELYDAILEVNLDGSWKIDWKV